MSAVESITPSVPAKPRRLTWLWITSFGLLAFIGAFCVFALRPWLEVRAVVTEYRTFMPYDMRAREAAKLGGPHAAWKLSLYLRLPDRLAPGKLLALQLLGDCGPVATPRLLAYINHPSRDMRQAAIEGLGQTRDPRAFEPLVAELASQNRGLRAEAAGALGALGDRRAFGLLIAAISDRDNELRRQAAQALGELRDPRGLESLLAALDDRDFSVRGAAARALGLIGDRRAVERLIAAMKGNGDDVVRGNAVESLGAIGDPRAIEPLIEALGDSDEYIRERAARALGDFDDPRILPALKGLLRRECEGWSLPESEALQILQTTAAGPAAEARKSIEKQRAQHPERPEPEPPPMRGM